MTTPAIHVRRATVEDLPQLINLWRHDNLPVSDLEKRFKEFQVAESGGKLVAALGMQITGQQARLHSEAFAQPEDADNLRGQFWNRIQTVAQNHGLVRLWNEISTPFWNQAGFQPVSAELLAKLPPEWNVQPRPWTFVQLRDEAALAPMIDKEFALFRESEKESTEKLFRQARILKMLAGVIAVIVFLLVIVWAFMFFKAQSNLQKP